MPQSIEHAMVIPIVQQIMDNQDDPEAWRSSLIELKIFDKEEADSLSKREVTLIQKALLTQKFSQLSSDELIEEAKKYKVQYHLSLDDDIQAINY